MGQLVRVSFLAPNGRRRRKSPKPPFFCASSPFAEPGVFARESGGDPRDARNGADGPSLSEPVGAEVRAGGTGRGAAGVPIEVSTDVLGSISREDRKEELSKSSLVEVVVKNLSRRSFCSVLAAPLRSRIFWKLENEESPISTR